MYARRSDDRATYTGQALINDSVVTPTTGAVVEAFAEEALSGVGTLAADLQARDVTRAEGRGAPITREEFASSEYVRDGISYYRGMTGESAKLLADRYDEMAHSREVISKANNGQLALGYGAAFAVGIFEPKNLATGLAAAAVLTPIAGAAVPAIGSARRALQASRAVGRYRELATLGFAEGLAAATLAEPSNRHSAKVLQEDYDMYDTLWNVGLSGVLGAGITTAPRFVKAKIRAHKTRAADIVADEMDLAMGQLVEGKYIDTGVVEASVLRDIATKPLNERVLLAESFVRHTETPEFKESFAASKVVDSNGQAVPVFGSPEEGVFFRDIDKAPGGSQARYLRLENPLEVTLRKSDSRSPAIIRKYRSIAQKSGNDGVIFRRGKSRRIEAAITLEGEAQQLRPFGERNISDVVSDIEKASIATERQAASKINTSEVTANRPSTETVYDTSEIDYVAESERIAGSLGDDADIAQLQQLQEQADSTTKALEDLSSCLVGR